MDLATLSPVTRKVDILHPQTGEPIGLAINLRPSSHPEVQRVRRKWLNERLSSKGRGNKVTAEQVEANALDQIIAAIESWTWGEGADGKPCTLNGEAPELSPESARKVLKAGGGFIKDQLDEELGDVAAFFRDAD